MARRGELKAVSLPPNQRPARRSEDYQVKMNWPCHENDKLFMFSCDLCEVGAVPKCGSVFTYHTDLSALSLKSIRDLSVYTAL